MIGSTGNTASAQSYPDVGEVGDRTEPEKEWTVSHRHQEYVDRDGTMGEFYHSLTLDWFGPYRDPGGPYYLHEFAVFANSLRVVDGELHPALRSTSIEATTNAHGSSDVTRFIPYPNEEYTAGHPKLKWLPGDYEVPKSLKIPVQAGVGHLNPYAGLALTAVDLTNSMSPKGSWNEKEDHVHWKISHGTTFPNPNYLKKVGIVSRFLVKVPKDARHASLNLESRYHTTKATDAEPRQNLHVDFDGRNQPSPYSYTYVPNPDDGRSHEELSQIPIGDVDGGTPRHLDSQEADVPRDWVTNGRFPDINGNGRLDNADVVDYFQNFSDSSMTRHVDAYDVNGNGRLDNADVVDLFQAV